jgi:hypothetical protein
VLERIRAFEDIDPPAGWEARAFERWLEEKRKR